MRTSVRQSGIFLFNIIPIYRPGISRVFDYARHKYQLASLPSSGQRIKQNTLFGAFEDQCGACLSGLDLLYNFATDGDRNYAKINWKDPGNFDATEPVAPTFTANQGFQGNGSTQYLTSGWDPDTDGVNYTQNEAGLFCYINNETVQGTRFALGSRGNGSATTGQISIVPKLLNSGTNKHFFSLQSLAAGVGTAVSSIGLFHIRRVSSTNTALFKDGAQVDADQSIASESLTTQDVYLGCLNADGVAAAFSEAQFGIFGIGASLTGKESALYTAWNNYFTSL